MSKVTKKQGFILFLENTLLQGYARVKSLLTFRYGKPSKVAAARIHCITSLPVISNCNSNHIEVFFMIL